MTLPLMAVGGRGVISVVSNEIPGGDGADGRSGRARRLRRGARDSHRIMPLMQVNFVESNPVPVKAAMAAMGLLEESYRLPMCRRPKPESKEKIAQGAEGARPPEGSARWSTWTRAARRGSVALTRALVDIDSTTGREGEAGAGWPTTCAAAASRSSSSRSTTTRFNVCATRRRRPTVVFSTHFDCVPPFFPSRVEGDRLYGRGACDAKGILAAQVAAAELLRRDGETRVGLLFVVGEERGSDGAQASRTRAADGCRFLVDGEPTDNRLGLATRGMLRLKLRASGRAAHSSFPGARRVGDRQADRRARRAAVDRAAGRSGARPHALHRRADQRRRRAERRLAVGGSRSDVPDGQRRRRASARRCAPLESRVAIEHVLEVPPVRMTTVPGFDAAVFPYTTDIPFLRALGRAAAVRPRLDSRRPHRRRVRLDSPNCARRSRTT